MPLFVFVSGYFSTKSNRTTQERVVSILKIYLLAQFFYFIVNKIIFENSSSEFQIFSPNWTMWYFLSLMCWYIISDFIKKKKIWFILSILISLYIGFDESVGAYASISRTFFFLPYFIAGMSFKKEFIEKLSKYKYTLAMLSLVFLVILYFLSDDIQVDLLFQYTRYLTYFDRPSFPFFIRIFHYIGSFILGAFIISAIPKRKTKLSKVGEISIVLFLSHSFIIKILYKYSFVNYSTPLKVLISELTILLITILVSLLYVYIKPLIKKTISELRF